MTERVLLVAIDTTNVNQPALSTAFQAYEAREFLNGAWIVKTNESAQAFYGRIQQALKGANAVVVPLDRAAIQNATLPGDLAGWVGVTRAA